jgi:putative membrane-bound dehydrogenase-like protein
MAKSAVVLLASLVCAQIDDLSRELPRLAPTAPAQALATFRIHEGFKLIQAAAEPLVADPVAACFDADQRLYVVEMGDYPFVENRPNGRVRVLQDRDNDGKYDQATLFLEGLAWPTGITCHDGGVFIIAAPELIYAKDTDGDGRADVRKVMFSGFGTQNVQALANGLMRGLDGWIYGAGGGNGGSITSPEHPDAVPVSINGRDFRFKPDGSAFEAIAGGGQFGQTFDDWGRRFVCSNSNHIRQVVLETRYTQRNPNLIPPASTIDIAAEGPAAPVFRISPAEPWRVVRTRQRAADPDFVKRAANTELVPVGFFTSATGVTIYRGSAFGDGYRGNAFIGDVGGNLVHRKHLEPDGVAYKATRADAGVEFLASTDNWFRPVNFVNTPDGTLLVLDMYRETIEHPASIPDAIKQHLDMTSGRDRGRIYNIVPEKFRKRPRMRLSEATTSEFVSLLGDPDSYWRETAQRLLVERPERDTVPLLRALLQSTDDPLAKLHALWTLENLQVLRFEDVNTALRDPSPGLRENAARLLDSLAERGPKVVSALVAVLRDPVRGVRFQAALSAGGLPDEDWADLWGEYDGRFLIDPYIRAAILSGAKGRVALLHLSISPNDAPAAAEWEEAYAEAEVFERKPEELAQRLAHGFESAKDTRRAMAVMRGYARGLGRKGETLPQLLDKTNVQMPLLARVVAVDLVWSDEPPSVRRDAMMLLAIADPGAVPTVLARLLTKDVSPEVQRAAIQQLGSVDKADPSTLLLERWPALSPAIKVEALEVLLAKPDRITKLFEAIQAGSFPKAEIDSTRRAQLLNHPTAEIRKQAAALFGTVLSKRAEVITRYQPASELAGNRERGRQVFRKVCATCHRAGDEGTAVGPDLSTVATRTPVELLTHIFDPNREVAPAYVGYVAATKDGRLHSGIIVQDTDTSITLKRAAGETESLLRSQVDELRSTGLSLMPEDLENQLQPQDVADLIEFIRSLGTRRD